MPIIDTNKLKRELEKVKTEMRKLTKAGLDRDTHRMTEEEGTQYQTFEAQAIDIRGQIDTIERNNALEIEDLANRTSGVDGNDDNVDGVLPQEKRFASLGEQLHAVIRAGSPNGKRDERLVESRAQGGMGEDTGSGGLYLVQTDFISEIMKKIYASAVLASKCRRLPIGANANGVAWNEVDESQRTAGYRWGGIRSYWVGAGTAVTASQMKFHKRKLDLEKNMAIVRITDELMQDAAALGNLTSDTVSQEMAFQLDDAIIRGTGAGMPMGWLNADCMVGVPIETGQTADTIVYENIVNMRSRLWAPSRAKSMWVINQDCEPQLHTMAFVVGLGGVPVYMPANGIAGLPYDSLYGRPVIPVEQASTVGDVGDISLVDLSQYLIIDKGGIKKDVSIHVYFTTDEQALRFVLRTNGMPLWASALTPFKGSNTLSPFITLDERA